MILMVNHMGSYVGKSADRIDKTAIPKRPSGQTSQASGSISYGQRQQLLNELPYAMEMISRQLKTIQGLMVDGNKQQVKLHQVNVDVIDAYKDINKNVIMQLEHVQDRVDALTIEQRVTNVLLADLLAVQKTVITDNTDSKRDVLRNDAYNLVLNGG